MEKTRLCVICKRYQMYHCQYCSFGECRLSTFMCQMEAMAWYTSLDFIFHVKILILFFVSDYQVVRGKIVLQIPFDFMCKFYTRLFSYLCLHSVNTGDFQEQSSIYLQIIRIQIPKYPSIKENLYLYDLAIKKIDQL